MAIAEHRRAPWAWMPRTKFVRPAPAAHAVLDPSVVDRAVRALAEQPLTLVVGEAGAGKTTLAAAAAAGHEGPVGWVNLDELDDDPEALAHLLVSVLDETVPGGCPAATELALSNLAGAGDPVRLTGVLVNDVMAGASSVVALVLDDLHVLRSPATLALLDRLIGRLPATLRLLATARTTPALSLPRLRARGQLEEIGAADLRLDAERAETLLNGHLGLGLPPAEVARVVDATGGWVAGVRLLATARGTGAARPALQGGGRVEALDAYLASEVLGGEPDDLASFLVDCSVLDELEPRVVAAVTGRDDAAAVLAGLHARHPLFLLVTADDPPAYRCHDLLRAFLRRRLAQTSQSRPAELHRAAASAVPSPAARVEHLLAAAAWDEAAGAVEALAAGPLPPAAELRRLASWVERLPPATVASRPRLGLVAGTAAAQRGAMAAAARLLDPVLAELERAGDFEGVWLAARGLHLATYDHERFRPILARLEGDPRFERLPASAQADHHLSSAYGLLFASEWSAVRDRVRTVLDLAAATGDLGAAEVLAQHLSPLLMGAGGLVDRVVAHARWVDRRFPQGPPLVRLGVHHQHAFTAFLQGRFDDALAAARAAGDLPDRLGGLPYLQSTLDWVIAGVAYARGDVRGADLHLRAAMARPAATDLDRELDPFRLGLLSRVQRRLGLRQELAELVAALEAGVAAARYQGYARLAAVSARAQEAWARGRLASAADRLRAGLDLEDGVRLVPGVGSLRLDLALVLDAMGERQAALTTLSEAEAAAARMDAPGTLAAAGDEAMALFDAAVAAGVAGPTLRAARSALGRPGGPAPQPVPGSAGVLTSREVEVLRLLAEGASNPSIAATLVLSLNTVKTHVRNVLTKLGAGSRGEAVAVARRLHLL